MPTANPHTQTMTNESTPSLKSSSTNWRTRSGGASAARPICAAKRASPPRSVTKRTAVKPRSRWRSSARLGRRAILVEEARDAWVGGAAELRRRALDRAVGQQQDDVVGD